MEQAMLKEEDKIFKNLYNDFGWSLEDSIKFVPEMDLTIKEEVDAVENRLIMFEGDQVHSGTCATDVSHRIVINSNFVTAEKFAERYE